MSDLIGNHIVRRWFSHGAAHVNQSIKYIGLNINVGYSQVIACWERINSF